jgi:hypothetical protein
MKKISIVVASFVLPVLASAQVYTIKDDYLVSIVSTIQELINLALPVIIAGAVVWFVYGIARYVLAAGDDEAKKSAKDKIVYGLIGLTVMVSVWGIVNIVVRTLGLTDTSIPASVDNLIPKARS